MALPPAQTSPHHAALIRAPFGADWGEAVKHTTFDIQCRLASLGFDPGPFDGIFGRRTDEALGDCASAQKKNAGTYRNWLFHPSGLHRIVMHWTAGAYGDIALERRAYHVLIDQHGRAVMGDYAPEANSDTSDGRYAAHTRALNSGSIGIAVDAMAGASESPFNAGSAPITAAQLDGLVREVASLCETYNIPVHPVSVLTHAEVQGTIGVRQRNKWDITWLPGMAAPAAPRTVGDMLRKLIAAELSA